MLKILAQQLLQKQINFVLGHADNHQQVLAPLDGKLIGLEVSDLDIQLFFEFEQSQLFLLEKCPPSRQAAVTISGNSKDFLQTAINQTQQKAIIGLNFSGDIGTGQQLQQLTEQLSFDWEARLADYTNDYIAYHSVKVLKGINQWLKQTLQTKLQNTSEILVEEWRLTPSPYEVEDFIQRVQQLQWAIDRVSARAQRLDSQLTADSDKS